MCLRAEKFNLLLICYLNASRPFLSLLHWKPQCQYAETQHFKVQVLAQGAFLAKEKKQHETLDNFFIYLPPDYEISVCQTHVGQENKQINIHVYGYILWEYWKPKYTNKIKCILYPVIYTHKLPFKSLRSESIKQITTIIQLNVLNWSKATVKTCYKRFLLWIKVFFRIL